MYFNKKEAESFLHALDPSAGIWTFQVFDPTGRQDLARVLSGPL